MIPTRLPSPALSRMLAYGYEPDVYYAPKPQECIDIAKELLAAQETLAKIANVITEATNG